MRGNPREVKAELLKRIRDMNREVRTQEKRNTEQTVSLAKQASTGPYKQITLDLMRHPYSKANPRAPMNAAILNFQSGRLYRAWKKRGPTMQSGNLVSMAFNTSREAALVEVSYKDPAKSSQMKRNLPEYVRGQMRKPRLQSIRRAIKRGLKI